MNGYASSPAFANVGNHKGHERVNDSGGCMRWEEKGDLSPDSQSEAVSII